MKQYIGVKMIEAKPMTREEAEMHLGRNVGGEEIGSGYLVEYDGAIRHGLQKMFLKKLTKK